MQGRQHGQNKRRTAALPTVTAIPTASAAIPAAADFSTTAAIPATIPTTIPTVIPAAAAANATTLQNPVGDSFLLDTEPVMQLIPVQMRVRSLTSTMSQGMKRNQKIFLRPLLLWHLQALI